MIRSGIGYDVHRISEKGRCILGGVEIPSDFGLEGHSDADVLLHAVSDALLGAAGLGDIGRYYPDGDPKIAGISSLKILESVVAWVKEKGYAIQNIDSVVIAERPRIAPYADRMRRNISKIAGVPEEAVNIKATTNERIGFIGRGEGIAAQAICTIVASAEDKRHAI